MAFKHSKRNKGISLIEIMVTTLILAVVVIGTSGYRYYASLDARRADVQITAVGVASLLLNSWKAQGGCLGYPVNDPNDPQGVNPVYKQVVEIAPGLNAYTNAPGLLVPEGFAGVGSSNNGSFRIVINGVNYFTTLSYKDQAGEPRLLNVQVAWVNDFGTWDWSKSYQTVALTTYAND